MSKKSIEAAGLTLTRVPGSFSYEAESVVGVFQFDSKEGRFKYVIENYNQWFSAEGLQQVVAALEELNKRFEDSGL